VTQRRVVITGYSVISALGTGNKKNWSGLLEGRSGIRQITRFDTTDFKTTIAGEVPDFTPEDFMSPKDVRSMDPFIQYSLGAAQEAVEMSGLLEKDARFSDEQAYRTGVIIGCGLGGLPGIEGGKEVVMARGPTRLTPFFIPSVIANLAPGQIALRYGMKGPNYTTTSACASGAHAIGEAYRLIKVGSCDVMVTGGAEATISPLAIAGFNSMRALSRRNDEPQRASRPFDKARDGFVCGEGAGVIVLEEYEAAKKRGASILGEVVGYAATCDAHHITAPAPGGEGAATAMRMALEDARIEGNKIGAINAHGTSTGLGDIAETQAIKSVFSEHAKKLKVSSTKSMVGHTLGAAGGVESVYTIMALQHQTVPPTINLEDQDPECDLDYVANKAQEWKHDYALNNSFGFGGTNVSLVFKRFSE